MWEFIVIKAREACKENKKVYLSQGLCAREMRLTIPISNSHFNWSIVTSKECILLFLFWTRNFVQFPLSQVFLFFSKMTHSSEKLKLKRWICWKISLGRRLALNSHWRRIWKNLRLGHMLDHLWLGRGMSRRWNIWRRSLFKYMILTQILMKIVSLSFNQVVGLKI